MLTNSKNEVVNLNEDNIKLKETINKQEIIMSEYNNSSHLYKQLNKEHEILKNKYTDDYLKSKIYNNNTKNEEVNILKDTINSININ